jgi:hypothetical protein
MSLLMPNRAAMPRPLRRVLWALVAVLALGGLTVAAWSVVMMMTLD